MTENNNLPCLSVGQIVTLLAKSYADLLGKGKSLKLAPSVMLWSEPGIGKSQAVRQLAREIKERTGKKVVVTDVRLLLFNPIDLRGIPTASEDKTSAVWLRPKIFQMDNSEDVVNILFLDELSAAPPSVQAAAYQITLDRAVGEHHLPDNCIVIAAGNRTTDRGVAYKMPKPLANRMMHFKVKTEFEAWKAWAMANNIHSIVIGFLSFRRDYLSTFDPASEDLAFPTPRSWEMVSDILNNITYTDFGEIAPLIDGLIGCGVATELETWLNVYSQLPSIDDIFAGKNPALPRNTDALYALTAALAKEMKANRTNRGKLVNALAFINRLPSDYSTVLLKDCLVDQDLKDVLKGMPEFMVWVQKKGAILNGIV